MSDTITARVPRSTSDMLVGGAVLLAGLLVVFLIASSTGERDVERSAMGARGLTEVLRADGQTARYAGFETVRVGDRVFRVLPVLDTDLTRPFERPAEDAEYLKTGTERDLPAWMLIAKTNTLPTLVIAPKWTRAARHSGYAHESLLLPPEIAAAGVAPLALFAGGMIRPDRDLLRFRAHGADGLIYAPQLFPPALAEGCTPVIDTDAGPLLITCIRDNAPPLFVLSDPDLMNSHGLALADNAAIAAAVIGEAADGDTVLIDTTDEIFVRPALSERPQRSWADLARIFAYPFSLAWAGLAALVALTLWRGAVRFGPAQRLFDDRLSASQEVSIAAKARLLRQAGNDRELLSRHIENRLRNIERAVFGTNASGPPEARILAHLGQKDHGLAEGFAAALATVKTVQGPGARTALGAFEQQAHRILHGS